jgi:CheY-like chemotaxis protein
MNAILIVEDNALVRELIRTCLQSLHANLRCVTSAEDGLEAIRSGFKPDLILTDIVLPQRSGTELAKHLRSHQGTQTLPIS